MKEKVMTIHDAEPGDIYVDDSGKIWRCISICPEPTVKFVEIEQTQGAQARLSRDGGVSGLMWKGWRRIWRKGELT